MKSIKLKNKIIAMLYQNISKPTQYEQLKNFFRKVLA